MKAVSRPLSFLKVYLQLSQPLRAMLADGAKFTVSVLRHLDKAVVVVVELSFVAVRQDLLHGLPAACKAALHIVLRNIMAATADTVGNACEAFSGGIQTDVE